MSTIHTLCFFEKVLTTFQSVDESALLEIADSSSISAADKQHYFAPDKKPKIDVGETVSKFKYLLGLTDLFQHFIDSRAKNDPVFAEVVQHLHNDTKPVSNGSHRRRKTEKEEDAELLKTDKTSSDITEFTESPSYVHGELRPYQIQGLNWLISLYQNNLSGILADEMGLGKTLQTISFLGYLRYHKNIKGPHIVITPKSTLDNWAREFHKWTPDVRILVLQGTKEERQDLIANRLMTCDFDVVIASYEIVIREKSSFRKFDWQYIVIDEAHRIKNEESLLSQIIRLFHSKNRLLITGTPLQNNLHELWALLNFILPDVFGDSDAFDLWFNPEEERSASEKEEGIVEQLHKVLKPFLLRRIKSDVEKSLLPKQEMNVYISMTDMQRKWYQKLLEKDIDAVNGALGKKESKTRLLNIVMQLRKCCNHPYLFEGAEPGPPYTTDEHLVYNAKKMIILDKILKKFQKEGSRVLIFSQMSRMLDILEDYCMFRSFEYCRIDGQTDHADRVQAIDDYNAPGSSKFVFLLTTRAGGLGINLTSADIVVLFDSDWNPQADLQAMDRAHRIGQTKQVKVFRFITENAIEEKVLERATQKLRLDQLVIQQGRNSGGVNSGAQQNGVGSKDDLLDMIQFGAAQIFNSKDNDSEGDVDIEALLAESDKKTKELNKKYEKLDLNALQNFTNDESVYEWNGENFKKKEPTAITAIGHGWINPAKRERKENYSIDLYYKDVMSAGSKPAQKSGPRPPKQLTIYDHQFLPLKLLELHEMEKNFYRKQVNYKVPLKSGTAKNLAEREEEQRLEQEEINNSRALTDEEKQLKEELLTQGFGHWNRRDFTHFVSLSAKYGRNAISLIAAEFEEKSVEEVREYAKAFWTRYEEIDGYERYISQIENGEDKIAKLKLQKESLRRKLATYRYPLQELVLKQPPAATTKKTFTEEEDRFLIVQMYRFGLDRADLFERIRDAIRLSPLLRFDFFLQSRTPAELSRRCTTLLSCITKEINPDLVPSRRDGVAKRKPDAVNADFKKRTRTR
ncbi:SWI/SNF-related matrix-associated actin-dependent regulator of chromatin subfamily A member 5 [Metschnikowia aff. pulcherrima]|uniref:SWI/SNF-related matrix-associated actin-dependent regulator of chromatin subfamily A member 5 n=1 Tax=Metschnikowia aff. pulcherrima TaxID=2163413 RepID=A0A4V1ADR0_9ASCO|nr:SWI/SNF-related matrix-associated actin-dependent regulator of chromatin subfamily A member 5 [Metschnikowia aff. pulcherrima]